MNNVKISFNNTEGWDTYDVIRDIVEQVNININNLDSCIYVTAYETSLGNLSHWQVTQDGSINNLNIWNQSQDNSLNCIINKLSTKVSGVGSPNKIVIWFSENSIYYDDNLIYDIENHRLGIGPIILDPSDPASLTIDSGIVASVNAIIAKGNVDNYYQFNIKNINNGNNCSSDVVATANNGSEDDFYVNVGINGSVYDRGFVGNANDTYLISSGENLILTNIKTGKHIILSTNGENSYLNERMRITSDGSVFIGTTVGNNKFEVDGDINTSGVFKISNVPLSSIYSSFSYVDGSFNKRDSSINNLYLLSTNCVKNASLGNDFYYGNSKLDVSTSFIREVSTHYIGDYNPLYNKNTNSLYLRSLNAVNGLIITTDSSLSILDASLTIPSIISITGKPFSGNLNETIQMLFFTDKQIRSKTSNIVSEIAPSGVTQLPANIDDDASQGLWFPLGTTQWNYNDSSIIWNNWNVFYGNTQSVVRSSFSFDASGYTDGIYAVYFNNFTETPQLEISQTFNRLSYTYKIYIGSLMIVSEKINMYYESPDIYGTPYLTRERNLFLNALSYKEIYLGANNDASTLNLSSGIYLIEGGSFRNVDFYNNLFTGSENIIDVSTISTLNIADLDSSTTIYDLNKGFYKSILQYKNNYYNSSTGFIESYSGARKFVLNSAYLFEKQSSIMLRRGGLYDTIQDAIDDIVYFNSNSYSISEIINQTHPLISYIIIATDCSTILDSNSFRIEIPSGVGSVSGGTGGTGILGASNIGSGSGVYDSVVDNIIQLKSIKSGGLNNINITSDDQTIYIDASIEDDDSSVEYLYENFVSKNYIDGSLNSRDLSINKLFSNKVDLSYVDGSLISRDLSINDLYNIKSDLSYVDASINVKSDLSYVDASLISLDLSIHNLYNIKADLSYVDVSLTNIRNTYTTKFYVDGSLSHVDLSINVLFNTKTTKAYVDGSLSLRDASLSKLFDYDIIQDASITNLLTYIDGSLYIRDSSLGNLSHWDVVQDLSLNFLRTYVDGSLSLRDASISKLFSYNVIQDTSLSFIRTYIDGSLSIRDTSLGNLSHWNVTQDLSLNFLRTYVDGSLNLKVNKSGDTMTGTLVLPSLRSTSDVSISGKLYIDNSTNATTPLSLSSIHTNGGISAKGNIYADGVLNAGADSSFSGYPSPASSGDIYYRPDLAMLYTYDSSRGKWLSVVRESFVATRDIINPGDQVYLGLGTVYMSASDGYRMQRSGTVISASWQNRTLINTTRSMYIMINSSTYSVLVTCASGNFGTQSEMNLDFSTGDILQFLSRPTASGSTLNNVFIQAEVAWR